MMSHVSYAGHLAQAGVDITLIYSGAHKVDGNQFEALPAEVRQDMQQRIDAARRMFAEKVAMFTGLSVDAVTEQRPPFLKVSPALMPGWRMN